MGSDTASRLIWRVAALGCLAGAWEALARWLDSLLLPTFIETIVALARLLRTRELWDALWLSNQAMLIGYALAALAGVALGLLMGRSRVAERYLTPYLQILMATSKAALIPLVIMAVGLGLWARVWIVFISAITVIAVNARIGLRTLDPAWVEMARSFGAAEGQVWRKVLLRGSLPAVLTGLRLGLTRAIAGMVSVELLLVALGIGRLILVYQGSFDAASVYATVLVVVCEALLLMQAWRCVERRTVWWAGEGVAR